MMRDTLINHTFKVDDKFYDADELKYSWYQTKIPDEMLGLFCQLYSRYFIPSRQYYHISMKIMMT